MQLDAARRQHLDALREDAVVEDHEAVGDLGLGLLQRLDEDQLAAAVGGEVLDQQHALAGLEVALDLGHAAEALGLLAHVDHRLLGQRRQEGGERDAGGLAARHHVDLVPADLAIDRLQRMAHDLGARLGIGDQLAAVDVDRARPPRGEDVRVLGPAMDGLDVEQQARGVPGLGRAAGPGRNCLAVQLVGRLVQRFSGRRLGLLLRRHWLPFPRSACDKMTAVCLASIHRTGKGDGARKTIEVSQSL